MKREVFRGDLAALGAAPNFTHWYNLAALGAANIRQAPLSLDHILNEDYSATN
jgi:hypothetical protein